MLLVWTLSYARGVSVGGRSRNGAHRRIEVLVWFRSFVYSGHGAENSRRKSERGFLPFRRLASCLAFCLSPIKTCWPCLRNNPDYHFRSILFPNWSIPSEGNRRERARHWKELQRGIELGPHILSTNTCSFKEMWSQGWR